MSSFCFDLLSHGECSQSVFHPGLWHGDAVLRRAGREPGWRQCELQCAIHSFVCSWSGPSHTHPSARAYPTVLYVKLIAAFSDIPVAPLILAKKLLVCLLGCDLFLCVCVDTKGRSARTS